MNELVGDFHTLFSWCYFIGTPSDTRMHFNNNIFYFPNQEKANEFFETRWYGDHAHSIFEWDIKSGWTLDFRE